jgi:hypothetical protein
MTELTRRRLDAGFEGWAIFYGNVRIGSISSRSGVPEWVNQWQWTCGFYPGCEIHEITAGTGADYGEAREAVANAWAKLLPLKTEGHFQEWRDFRDFTKWKDAMRDTKLPLPTQSTTGVSKCFCGAELSIKDVPNHIRTVHTQMKKDDVAIQD